MIIYRPHRGSLEDAMREVKEFESIDQMKEFIVKDWADAFSADDIVIDEKNPTPDERIGWEDTMYVCVKRMQDIDYIEKYGTAQCIGMCATRYKRPWRNE